jgi:hypothetical protein
MTEAAIRTGAHKLFWSNATTQFEVIVSPNQRWLGEEKIRQRTMKRVGTHLIPFMIAMFCANFLDRVNISFAVSANESRSSSNAQVYGFAAGILFVSYTGLEVPSNLILQRVDHFVTSGPARL